MFVNLIMSNFRNVGGTSSGFRHNLTGKLSHVSSDILILVSNLFLVVTFGSCDGRNSFIGRKLTTKNNKVE